MAIRDMDKKKHQVGYNIRRLREIIGIKQFTLAELCGWSQQQISKIENSSKLNDKTLNIVAKALGVSPKLILDFDENVLITTINAIHELNLLSKNLNLPDDKNIRTIDVVFSKVDLKEEPFQSLISSIDNFENDIRVLKENLFLYFR